MAKPKKIKIIPSETVTSKLRDVAKELISRGAQDFNISDLLDQIMNEKRTFQVIDDFVNNHTPESYKIKCLLEIPEEREKLLAYTKNKSFGISTEKLS